MEILVKRNYGYVLIIKADNVHIEEDIEDRIYPKKEDGTSDFSKRPDRDIKDEYMDLFARALDDMAYYREKEYDSSGLIETLFSKLPSNIASDLASKLSKEYTEDVH